MDTYVIIVGALVFVAVVCIGFAVLGAVLERKKPMVTRLSNPEIWPDAEEESIPQPLLLQALHYIGKALLPVASTQTTAEELAKAGYYSRGAPALFIGAKILLLLLGLAVAGVLVIPMGFSPPVTFLMVVGTGTILCCVPNGIVSYQTHRHREKVRRRLPDVVDLMEICVSSGMALDTSWNLISDEIRHVEPTMADEMVLANLEMHLGASRVTALRDLAERTGADAIDTLATMLVQSERFGTSISDTLRTFSTSLREEQSTRAQEDAEKVGVKLLFPMIFLVFPAFMIVLVGPAVIALSKVLTEL